MIFTVRAWSIANFGDVQKMAQDVQKLLDEGWLPNGNLAFFHSILHQAPRLTGGPVEQGYVQIFARQMPAAPKAES